MPPPENRTMKKLFVLLMLCIPAASFSQTTTHTAEDSLHQGTSKSKVSIGGYGEAKITYVTEAEEAEANLERVVLFTGYRFNNRISFHSELEIEDAKIEGGEPGGEVALEQAYLKFDVGRTHYLTAGLIIPRIGIINENHLPTTFNGNNRPFVERFVIPSTWRELGIGWYGNIEKAGGLQYTIAVLNGLHSSGFGEGAAIRGGRFEGHDASMSNIGVTASVGYLIKGLRLQTSVYYGGTVAKTIEQLDTVLDIPTTLEGGAFGSPVSLWEANAQYDWKALNVRGLLAMTNFQDAGNAATIFGNNPVRTSLGWYAEAGVNLLYGAYKNEKKLIVFGRYESIDMAHALPVDGTDTNLERRYIVGGLTFQPVNGVAIKLDYVGLNAIEDEGFVNLGIGYSF